MLPSWVAEPGPLEPVRTRGRSRFVARTLAEIPRFMREVVLAERTARRPGYLQGLDARAKLISIVGLVVAAAFLHHAASLWLVGAFAVLAAGLSRIGIGALFRRVWWFLPGVFVIVAVPAVFNVITPGEPLVRIAALGEGTRLGPIDLPAELAITRQGLASGVLLVSRIAVGVVLAVTLTLTTRWQDLIKAGYTSATAPFVLILAMMYRYVFVLLRAVEQMHLGKRARTISMDSLKAERRWVGGRVAALFVRSRHLTERVHAAMLARGYRGEPRVLAESRFGWPEAAWVLCCALVIGLAVFGDRVVLAGLRW